MEKVIMVLITLFCVGYSLPFSDKLFPKNDLNKAFDTVSRQIREKKWDPKSVTVLLFIFADKNNDKLLSSSELVNFLVQFGTASRDQANTAAQAMINLGDQNGDRLLNSKETMVAVREISDML